MDRAIDRQHGLKPCDHPEEKRGGEPAISGTSPWMLVRHEAAIASGSAVPIPIPRPRHVTVVEAKPTEAPQRRQGVRRLIATETTGPPIVNRRSGILDGMVTCRTRN